VAGEAGAPRPLISVGLPTFNRDHSLRRAIASVLTQDCRDLELVISDNASSDTTQRICSEYSSLDNRIRYIRQTVNQGASANFRTVLTEARGQYFMWLSDDDWLSPSYLSRCLSVLQESADIALVCGTARYTDEGEHGSTGVILNLLQDSPTHRVLSFYRQVNDNGTFYGLSRRETVLRYPMQDVLGGDWLFMAALAFHGKIQTLEDVYINRSSTGASADVRSLAKRYGFSERAARQPHRAIALTIARDIALTSPVFARLGAISRWSLAARSALAIHKRFVEADGRTRKLAGRIRARVKRLA
jgi:glycosyltransferase involved in cell wall biosynthesis